MANEATKPLESRLRDPACSIRGAKNGARDGILPLVFTKRLCHVIDGRINRIVPVEEIARNDDHISPSRNIHTGAADEYRPQVGIMEELETLEDGAIETATVLKGILARLTA